MKELIIDLKVIETQSKLKADEFTSFKTAVKQIPLSKFDEIAHPIVEEITSQIDCTHCGNCCRYQEPGVSEEEIIILAEQKNISTESFKEQFIATDKENISFLCVQPCTFLDGNKCSIYSFRPNSCADFPGLHRPRLKWRMKQVEENYGICPIVFNVVERLKEML